jgi:hypothetical protein
VVVVLNGKRLESSLPDMTTAVIVTMVAADVRRQQPLHPTAQITIFVRSEKQVEMVIQQAVPDQSHANFVVCLPHQIDERQKIVRLVKNVIAAIATVQNVIQKPTLRRSWHLDRLTSHFGELK